MVLGQRPSARRTKLKLCQFSRLAEVHSTAHDTTAADTVVNVYTSGMFIIEKLIAASGDTVVAHQIELEDAGIYMQHAM